jgi:hypothetical protein
MQAGRKLHQNDFETDEPGKQTMNDAKYQPVESQSFSS